MPRRRALGIVLAVCGGLTALALGMWACSRPAPPVMKRILASDEQKLDNVEAGRAGVRHVAIDLRDAWTQVLGEPIDVTLDAQGRAKLQTAALLIAPKGVELPEAAEIVFELEWDAGLGVTERAQGVDARAATRVWTPLTLDLGVALEHRTTLRLRARAEGKLPAGVRVAWQIPHVADYFGAPLSEPKQALAQRATGTRPAPNVLFISVDTLRADHLGCYGYARDTSPHIDALAKQSVRFENALTQAPWTLPSYGSVFTGLDPSRHWAGAVYSREHCFGHDVTAPSTKGRHAQPLDASVKTLAELFAESGWQTAGFVNNQFLAPSYGLDRGFQRYALYEYNASYGVDLARDWIAERDRPWFCFVHLMDPHMRYGPPEPWDAKFADAPLAQTKAEGWPPALDAVRASKTAASDEAFKARLIAYYDAEIAFTDNEIGRLLATLESSGALANTIVVFHSDHGEEFWEHGGFEHGHTLHQELLHVPVMIRFDGHLAPRVVPERMRAYDLFPTLLELCGLPVPADLDAQSLVPWLDGRAKPVDRDAISEFMLTTNRESKASWRGALKTIVSGARDDEVYDLDADPGERTNLATERAAYAAAERKRLIERHSRAWAHHPKAVEVRLTEGELHRQDGFGYGDGSDAGAGADVLAPCEDQ